MQKITVKDTRDNLSEIIELVSGGKKSFIITKFGKPKAQIIPIEAKKQEAKTFNLSDAYGIWSDRTDIDNATEWVSKTRKQWSKRNE